MRQIQRNSLNFSTAAAMALLVGTGNASANVLEEVIVTAQKREQNL